VAYPCIGWWYVLDKVVAIPVWRSHFRSWWQNHIIHWRRSFALWLLFLSFTFSAYLRLFFLFQPNPPEVFFWMMIIFSIIRYVQTNNNSGCMYLE
jgi:hypothetical protein